MKRFLQGSCDEYCQAEEEETQTVLQLVAHFISQSLVFKFFDENEIGTHASSREFGQNALIFPAASRKMEIISLLLNKGAGTGEEPAGIISRCTALPKQHKARPSQSY